MRFSFAAIGAAALIATLGLMPALAHEGHDHEPQATPVSGNIAARGEAASDAFELVAVASGPELLIYLDRFATNAPVDGATIEVETPQGPVKATPHAGNAYRLDAPWLAKPGRFDLIFMVTADGAADVLPLTLDLSSRPATSEPGASSPGRQSWSDRARTLMQPVVLVAAALGFLLGGVLTALARRRRGAVALILVCACALGSGKSIAHEGHQNGDPNPLPLAAGNELAQRLPDGAIFVPKPIQRIFGLRTALIETGTYRRSVELPGKIIPDPNASGYVQASVGGRLTPPPGGSRASARSCSRATCSLTSRRPISRSMSPTCASKANSTSRFRIVERRLARYEQLAPGGAIARSQLEDTRLELLGLRERRASLDKVRREPEALVAPVSV